MTPAPHKPQNPQNSSHTGPDQRRSHSASFTADPPQNSPQSPQKPGAAPAAHFCGTACEFCGTYPADPITAGQHASAAYSAVSAVFADGPARPCTTDRATADRREDRR